MFRATANKHPDKDSLLIQTKVAKVDSTGRRNTSDYGGVYGTTSRMDAKVDGEMDDALARCAVTSQRD